MFLFKCGQSATDCSECLAVDSQERKCGWCKNNATCTVELGCIGRWIGKVGDQDCPASFISTISPKSGPLEGGTKFIIQGSNLGLKFQDVSIVTVNGQECDLKEEFYVPGKTSVVGKAVFCILL